MIKNNKLPTPTLVKTWLWMALHAEDPHIREQGLQRVVAVFGTIKNAQSYLMGDEVLEY